MPSIGVILKKIREARKMPQGQMASLLGVTQNFLSQVEHGKKNVSLTTLHEFAGNLGLSKDIILIAASDVPSELDGNRQKKFIEMQNDLLEYIVMSSK